jgi:hypothetical protein
MRTERSDGVYRKGRSLEIIDSIDPALMLRRRLQLDVMLCLNYAAPKEVIFNWRPQTHALLRS